MLTPCPILVGRGGDGWRGGWTIRESLVSTKPRPKRGTHTAKKGRDHVRSLLSGTQATRHTAHDDKKRPRLWQWPPVAGCGRRTHSNGKGWARRLQNSLACAAPERKTHSLLGPASRATAGSDQVPGRAPWRGKSCSRAGQQKRQYGSTAQRCDAEQGLNRALTKRKEEKGVSRGGGSTTGPNSHGQHQWRTRRTHDAACILSAHREAHNAGTPILSSLSSPRPASWL